MGFRNMQEKLENFNATLNDSSKIKQYVFPSKTFALKASRLEFVLKKFQTVTFIFVSEFSRGIQN